MELKHPEFALRLAADLRREGYDFRLKLIGGGELEEKLKEQIRQEELSGLVEMTGFLSPGKCVWRWRKAISSCSPATTWRAGGPWSMRP